MGRYAQARRRGGGTITDVCPAISTGEQSAAHLDDDTVHAECVDIGDDKPAGYWLLQEQAFISTGPWTVINASQDLDNPLTTDAPVANGEAFACRVAQHADGSGCSSVRSNFLIAS